MVGEIVLIAVAVYAPYYIKWSRVSKNNLALLGQEAPTLNFGGCQFRDLNNNGEPDIYEDSRGIVDSKVEDLINQMDIEKSRHVIYSNDHFGHGCSYN